MISRDPFRVHSPLDVHTQFHFKYAYFSVVYSIFLQQLGTLLTTKIQYSANLKRNKVHPVAAACIHEHGAHSIWWRSHPCAGMPFLTYDKMCYGYFYASGNPTFCFFQECRFSELTTRIRKNIHESEYVLLLHAYPEFSAQWMNQVEKIQSEAVCAMDWPDT